MKHKVDYVNLFIGTAGSGHALVGPQLPHGMVKLGPDTISLPCGGYDYNDGIILGFSHTHLEGVGGNGGRGNIMLSAATGPLKVEEQEYASSFSHDDETARVGYYQVRLLDYDINVELAATRHCGYHRYWFPASQSARILLDIGHTLGKRFNNCLGGHIEVKDNRSFCGWGIYPLLRDVSQTMKIYFYGETSVPFVSHGLWNGAQVNDGAMQMDGSKIGLYMNYGADTEHTVDVKVAISYVSCERAQKSLYAEIPGFDFERCVMQAGNEWEDVLERISVESDCEDDLIQFYSALYRSVNQPTDYAEDDVYFDGVGGGCVYPSDGHAFYSDDWAIWDTFRTTHPLQNLIEPERTQDQALSLIRMYEHGGWLPMCTAPALGYNQTMIGHNASSVMLDCMITGADDVDWEQAYMAMKKQATQNHENIELRMLGTNPEYAEKGYLPHDAIPGNQFSVSESLEYIYGDWCTAQMAQHLGKIEDYEFFSSRAMNYQKLFDCRRGFMVPRLRDGNFIQEFNPTDAFKNGFCETSSWEYTFFVPHDIQGLINLIGGDQEFEERLDTFFSKKIYNNQNETGIQTPFLYNYAGVPSKTQKLTLDLVRNGHKNKPDGLYGEDDAGAMSAWYVFASAGLYPVCPGQGIYVITSPNFERVSFKLGDTTFTIRCINFSRKNCYIQGALLNGRELGKVYLTFEQLRQGGELVLYMGDTISGWGTTFESRPPSMTKIRMKPEIESAFIENAKPDGYFDLVCKVINNGADGTWVARPQANGHLAGNIRIALSAGECKKISIPCKAYNLGINRVTLDGLCCGELEVSSGSGEWLHVTEPLKLNRLYCRGENLQPVTVTAKLANYGLEDAQAQIPLYVNGTLCQSACCAVASGETGEVSFTFMPDAVCGYRLQVLDSAVAEYDVTQPPDAEYCTCATVSDAEYSQCGKNIYMRMRGYQSMSKVAILYRRYAIKGDFEATVCVRYDENTNPYSPSGIIVTNTIGLEAAPGQVMMCAGSQRGFIFEWCGHESKLLREYTGYEGCPNHPYWYKVVKRGKSVAGYYSFDESNWRLLNEVTMDDIAPAQFVGLVGNSGSADARLIKYSDFHITRL